MFAAFSIPKPESCADCHIVRSLNKYIGECPLNNNARVSLGDNCRDANCKLLFFDDMRNTFSAAQIREVLETLIQNADELEQISNESVDENKKKDVENELKGIAFAMKVLVKKLGIKDVEKWVLG